MVWDGPSRSPNPDDVPGQPVPPPQPQQPSGGYGQPGGYGSAPTSNRSSAALPRSKQTAIILAVLLVIAIGVIIVLLLTG
jgi:hypothetical protein